MPTADGATTPAAIVSRCRSVQRQLDASVPGSLEHHRLTALVRDLAEEYRIAMGGKADNRRTYHEQRPDSPRS